MLDASISVLFLLSNPSYFDTNFATRASMCLKSPEKIPYTSYVEDCCAILSSQAEYASDHFLAITVRLQCIIDRIHDTFTGEPIASKQVSTPMVLQVNFYQKELEAFKASIPLPIQEDRK